MTPGSGLVVSSLRVRFGQTWALDDFSLDVTPGEFLVLLGPSGCGKSTLLGTIAGLIPLEGGRVVLGGRDVTRLEPGERDLALVFQSYALYPTMTVAGNLEFGMRMRGVPRVERQVMLRDTARLLQIEALLPRRPSQLSGGQQQRVAIGRALLRGSGLLLFDEPLSSLDAPLRAEMRGEIRRIHDRTGATSLYVTHDQAEAMAMGTRIAVMSDGKIVQVDTPQAVYDHPANLFVGRFVGTPGMNLISARLVHRDGLVLADAAGMVLPLGSYEWASHPEPDRPVFVGLRPEDVCIGTLPTPIGIVVPSLVEPTGADMLVRFPFAGTELLARVERSAGAVAGQAAAFALDLQRASVFCAQTGRRL